MDDFLQRPECSLAVIGKPGKSIRLGPPPETIAIASTAIFATHWPERAVWEMPVGAAYWYEALARRQKDPIDFMTAEEREWQNELEATGFKSWEPKAGPESIQSQIYALWNIRDNAGSERSSANYSTPTHNVDAAFFLQFEIRTKRELFNGVHGRFIRTYLYSHTILPTLNT